MAIGTTRPGWSVEGIGQAPSSKTPVSKLLPDREHTRHLTNDNPLYTPAPVAPTYISTSWSQICSHWWTPARHRLPHSIVSTTYTLESLWDPKEREFFVVLFSFPEFRENWPMSSFACPAQHAFSLPVAESCQMADGPADWCPEFSQVLLHNLSDKDLTTHTTKRFPPPPTHSCSYM